MNPRNRTLVPLGLALLTLLAVPPRLALAHTSGITRVDVIVEPAALRVNLGLNARDLLQNVLSDSLGQARFSDAAQLEAAAARIGDYVTRRIRLRVDGASFTLLATGWPPPAGAGIDFVAPIPGQAEARPQTVALSLVGALPPGARRLDLTLDLYREDDFTALFDITSRRAGAGPSRTDYVKAGTTVAFDLQNEMLDEPTVSARPPAASSRDAARSGVAQPTAAPLLKTVRQFLSLGFSHIVPHGLDHILFVIGLFLLTPRIRPLLKQVTAFTLAHSLTLALAMLGLVRLSPAVVEPLIALSIAVVAVENILQREARPGRWILVFAFGLIHGLGFASVLEDLGVPDGRFLPALISFNLGVEAGQLAVLGVAALLVLPVRQASYRRWVAVPASLVIALTGVVWAVQRILPSLSR